MQQIQHDESSARYSDRQHTAASLRAADAMHALLRLGRLMLVNGAPTETVQERVTALAGRMGYTINLLIFAEGLLITIQDEQGFLTKLGPTIAGMTVDIRALEMLDEVARGGVDGRPDTRLIEQQLDQVEFRPTRYPQWFMALGTALTAGSLAWLFGGSLPAIGASALAGVVNVLLRARLQAHAVNAIASAGIIAFASGLAACLVTQAFPDSSSVFCLVAAGTILIPGVPLINGMRETLGYRFGAGLSQLAFAMATILAVVFGLLVAANLTGVALADGGNPRMPEFFEVLLFSGLAGMGFVVHFNAPLRVAWVCLGCAALGHGVRSALMHLDVSIPMGSLAGALAAAVFAKIFADRFRMPAVTFTFPGVVTLLPAPEAFRAALGALDIMHAGAAAPPALIGATIGMAVTVVLVVAAIAAGLSLVLAMPFGSAGLMTGSRPDPR